MPFFAQRRQDQTEGALLTWEECTMPLLKGHATLPTVLMQRGPPTLRNFISSLSLDPKLKQIFLFHVSCDRQSFYPSPITALQQCLPVRHTHDVSIPIGNGGTRMHYNKQRPSETSNSWFLPFASVPITIPVPHRLFVTTIPWPTQQTWPNVFLFTREAYRLLHLCRSSSYPHSLSVLVASHERNIHAFLDFLLFSWFPVFPEIECHQRKGAPVVCG